jgi:glutathione peroxidase
MADPMRKLLFICIVIIIGLVLIKRKDMTWRQSILKTVYPLIMLKSKLFPGKMATLENTQLTKPPVSFYELTAVANDGTVIDFHSFAGKKVLLVNTASDCGYTGQFDELEKLHRQYKNLVVIGFPANDFKEQEKKDDASIQQFCKINFGVTFLLMQKTHVVHGWCDKAPSWNFNKYIVSEEGVLLNYFAQTVSPLDKKFIAVIEK